MAEMQGSKNELFWSLGSPPYHNDYNRSVPNKWAQIENLRPVSTNAAATCKKILSTEWYSLTFATPHLMM